MQKKATPLESRISSTWNHLEEFVRKQGQRFIQTLLEEEVTELLGQTKSVRREVTDTSRALCSRRLSLTGVFFYNPAR